MDLVHTEVRCIWLVFSGGLCPPNNRGYEKNGGQGPPYEVLPRAGGFNGKGSKSDDTVFRH